MGAVCFHTTWHGGADHQVYSPQHLVPRDAGQDPAVPTRPASQTLLSDEVTTLQGRREAD